MVRSVNLPTRLLPCIQHHLHRGQCVLPTAGWYPHPFDYISYNLSSALLPHHILSHTRFNDIPSYLSYPTYQQQILISFSTNVSANLPIDMPSVVLSIIPSVYHPSSKATLVTCNNNNLLRHPPPLSTPHHPRKYWTFDPKVTSSSIHRPSHNKVCANDSVVTIHHHRHRN